MKLTPIIFAGLLFLGLTFAQSTGGGTGGSTGGEGGASPSENAQLGATAEIVDAEGNVIGDANFTTGTDEGGQAYVTIQVGLSPDAGLEPGEHGFHIHEVGECSAPDFESAGGHYNPTGAQHGLLNPEGAHAGDLPNLVVGQGGVVDYVVTTALVTLGEGERTLFDSDGSAVMIHEGPDDYITDSSGDSGSRVACGVITQP